MDRSARKVLAGLGVAVLAAAIAGPVAAQSPAASGAAGSYKIGVSNWLQGNGWREEMICSIKAEALQSGRVSDLVIAHRTTDAAGQLEDMRNLIGAGVNAIIVNPISPDALNDAITEATGQGIKVVAVDLAATAPDTYLFANDQEEYGYLGAKWLFETMKGTGNVLYMRGAAGTSADTDRDAGFQRAKAEYPDIKIAQEVYTNWDQATGVQQVNDFLATGQALDGIWTSGIDNVIVDALKTAGHAFVPIVGADNAGFVSQLLNPTDYPGLVGVAVTNSAAVGGAGLNLALQILDGNEPAQAQNLTTPVAWDNVTEEGKAALATAYDADIIAKSDLWPLVYALPPYTTYSKEQIIACKGPND
jgi:ribose transport system substrate-binding protein